MKFRNSSRRKVVKENMELLKLGGNIRKLRRRRGWTQVQLASRAGLDQTYISGLEIGRRDANPSLLSVMRIARALETSPDKLCAKMVGH
jgi:transcriptional regulator with XRE-family HTH domain